MDLHAFGHRAFEVFVENPLHPPVLATDSYLPVTLAQTCLPKPAAGLLKLIDPIPQITNLLELRFAFLLFWVPNRNTARPL
jgi:hypothetical protein